MYISYDCLLHSWTMCRGRMRYGLSNFMLIDIVVETQQLAKCINMRMEQTKMIATYRPKISVFTARNLKVENMINKSQSKIVGIVDGFCVCFWCLWKMKSESVDLTPFVLANRRENIVSVNWLNIEKEQIRILNFYEFGNCLRIFICIQMRLNDEHEYEKYHCR